MKQVYCTGHTCNTRTITETINWALSTALCSLAPTVSFLFLSLFEAGCTCTVCTGTDQTQHTGLTVDFRISPCCRGRVGFRTLVCLSRSYASPKCTLQPFYIPSELLFSLTHPLCLSIPHPFAYFFVYSWANSLPPPQLFHHPRIYSQL